MNREQLLGLATGILFGVLLQRGRVLRFEKQIGAMRLQDMTIFKFMLSAILVGMTGILPLAEAGVIQLSHKAMNLGAVGLGGLLFGAGWAVMGYCPGTAVGAVGEGRWHALFALAGMLLGAALYAESYPLLKASVLALKDWGKVDLPGVTGLSPWVVLPAMWAGSLLAFRWFERRGL